MQVLTVKNGLLLLLIASFQWGQSQCLLTSSHDTEQEVMDCLNACGCLDLILPEGTTINMDDTWDLSALGDLTFTIRGQNSSLIFTGNGGNATQIRMNEFSILIIEEETNTQALVANGSPGQNRVYFGSAFYNGNQFPDIISAGGAQADGVLPVELVSFSASSNGQKVLLKWETSSEKNNLGFEIERSSDGREWTIIDMVAGQGTTSVSQSYTFTDKRPLYGHNYYRLKQIDYDGVFEYSYIQEAHIPLPKEQLAQAFPNPSNGHFTLSLSNPQLQKASIKITNTAGEVLWKKYFLKTEAVNYWEEVITLSQREMVFIITQVGDQVYTQKLALIDKN